MKTIRLLPAFPCLEIHPACWLLLFTSTSTLGLPLITSVIETGGDGPPVATMTGETVSGGTRNGYLVPVFGEDVGAMPDRTHQWNGATAELPLPDYLVGGEYIMIRNDNRDNATLELQVTVGEDALMYLLVDNRLTDGNGTNPPEDGLPVTEWANMAWLGQDGFEPVLNGLNRAVDPTVPDEVGVDEAGDGVGPGVAINNYSSVYVKSISAGTITLHQPDNGGRNMYGVVVKLPPGSLNNPPQVLDVIPANNSLFHAGDQLTFSATTISPNQIAPAGIRLTLNGTDVSSSLQIGGTTSSRTAKFVGLKPNTIYQAVISVADQAARTTTSTVNFDTFSTATTTVIEAEDYNYDSGKFLSPSTAAGYAGLTGTPEIDFHDSSVTAATEYRPGDLVGLAAAADGPRAFFTGAGATDYEVGGFVDGDWLNYTRVVTADRYRVLLRASASATEQLVRLESVNGDATTTSQTTFALGQFSIPAGAYGYVPLADVSLNPVEVSLSGSTTLRMSALPSANPTRTMNFLLLVPSTASERIPYVSLASPADGAVDVPLDVVVKLHLAHGTGQIVRDSVALTFNGSPVTAQATITTTPQGFEITYDPPGDLPRNTPCSVGVAFSDSGGATFSGQRTFTTLVSRPVITSVVETGGDDSDNTPAQYTGQVIQHPNLGAIRVGTFREEAPAFRDRVHQWNGATPTLPLPPYLVGREYIMIRNDNRENSPFQIDVTLSAEAIVYLLVDNRLTDADAATPPDFSAGSMSWLIDGGWTPVLNGLNRAGANDRPDEVGVDEGADGVGPGVAINNWSSVYSKTVPAGVLSLYQADNSGQNMYGVVVAAKELPPVPPVISAPKLANGMVSFTWTGGGRLLQADEIDGQWKDVPGNPQGSYQVSPADPRKFYRVVVP